MDYELSINNQRKKIAIRSLSANASEYQVRFLSKDRKVAEKKVSISAQKPDGLLVSIDEKIYLVSKVERVRSGIQFSLNDSQYLALLQASVSIQKSETGTESSVASIGEVVVSNFPARVVSVPVKVGNSLKEGDTIIILEAMKMEAQIKVPKKCTIQEILVREGDMVDRGATLARLKFEN